MHKKKFCICLLINFFLVHFSVVAEIKNSIGTSVPGVGALGRIEPRSRVVMVSHNAGPEGARVEQLFVQEADQVRSNAKLALLSDHKQKKAQVDAARTHVDVLQAQRNVEQVSFAFYKKEYLRYQSLEKKSMASASVTDEKRLAYVQSEANLKRLLAEIRHARSELSVFEADLENTLVRAPIAGTILKILAWPGERIRDNGLLEMADLTQLDVVAEIYESDMLFVRTGQKALIDAAGFPRSYRAIVRELGFQVKKNDLNDTDPLADRDNRIVEVRLTLEPGAVRALQNQIFRQVHVRIQP